MKYVNVSLINQSLKIPNESSNAYKNRDGREPFRQELRSRSSSLQRFTFHITRNSFSGFLDLLFVTVSIGEIHNFPFLRYLVFTFRNCLYHVTFGHLNHFHDSSLFTKIYFGWSPGSRPRLPNLSMIQQANIYDRHHDRYTSFACLNENKSRTHQASISARTHSTEYRTTRANEAHPPQISLTLASIYPQICNQKKKPSQHSHPDSKRGFFLFFFFFWRRLASFFPCTCSYDDYTCHGRITASLYLTSLPVL